MNRESNGHGALGKFDAAAFGFGDLEVIGHEIELLAGHFESRMVVNFHGGS